MRLVSLQLGFRAGPWAMRVAPIGGPSCPVATKLSLIFGSDLAESGFCEKKDDQVVVGYSVHTERSVMVHCNMSL